MVLGDLALPGMGIDSKRREHLVDRVGLIIHNGALVHHGLPYSSLRDSNVMGTREVIELACARSTPLHYVSSISVLPPLTEAQGRRFLESDSVVDVPPPMGGYNLSKWVAERLIVQAGDRGLPVAVYRPGPISGDSVTGAFNRNDFLYRLMVGYLQSGMAPHGEMPLDLLPVDYVGRVVVWLALRGADLCSRSVRCFHLLHPKPASSEMLFQACLEAGFRIKRVPYDTWFKHLSEIAQSGDFNHALYPLVGMFSSREGTTRPAGSLMTVPYDTSVARTALQGAPFEPPELAKELFGMYLKAMIRSGVFRDGPLHD